MFIFAVLQLWVVQRQIDYTQFFNIVSHRLQNAAEQTTFSGSWQPGKYFVFSCFKLIMSDSFCPLTISSWTYIETVSV